MKRRLISDILIIIAFVIINELAHAILFDVFSPPRDNGTMASLCGDLLLSAILMGLMYVRHHKKKISLLYGFLLSVLLLIIVHTIQYPTMTNLYIILYKLSLTILLPILFKKSLTLKEKKEHSVNILDDTQKDF